jgi:hypothetical protein
VQYDEAPWGGRGGQVPDIASISHVTAH